MHFRGFFSSFHRTWRHLRWLHRRVEHGRHVPYHHRGLRTSVILSLQSGRPQAYTGKLGHANEGHIYWQWVGRLTATMMQFLCVTNWPSLEKGLHEKATRSMAGSEVRRKGIQSVPIANWLALLDARMRLYRPASTIPRRIDWGRRVEWDLKTN